MRPRSRRRLGWLAPAVAGLVLALVSCGGDDGDPTADPASETTPTTPASQSRAAAEPIVLEAPADAGAGRCRPPSVQVLAGAAVAFDGTVSHLEDEVADLDVSRWYRGGPAEVATVRAQPESMQALVGAVALEEGGRFLVAADDSGVLLVCGLSAPWSEDLAKLYAEAFGG
jgi:hypothetical protein